jgi:DNA repair protein RecN (Recombination protein N)
MLRSLSIRDVVLIEKLDLTFQPGLCVLTGETGAGKSILLDALGLALGERAEVGLVRYGAAQASVAAEFDSDGGHPAVALLAEQGIEEADGRLILRRVVGADGRSRAFVNDQPVSVTLLRQIGDACVEIHGQFDNQRLMHTATHRALLDAYGGLAGEVAATAHAHRVWRAAAEAFERAGAELAQARHEEEFLRHAVDELEALAPQPGEEAALAERRAVMMHAEKLIEAMNQATAELAAGAGVEGALRSAARVLERVADKAEGRLAAALEALDRAAVEAAEAVVLLDRASADMDLDPRSLEKVEERLFALRALARKHGVDVDHLPAVLDRLKGKLGAIEDGGDRLRRLEEETVSARQAYVKAAGALHERRHVAAVRLDTAMAGELGPLKFGNARFGTRIDTVEEGAWGEHGCDAVAFEVATNPGMPPGPLNKISSGGEMSRFMLALKVVLAHADPVPTIIFDEVDANVGGAVADAVGERLSHLAGHFQVLVVTHSPQVAARGTHHWRVSKKVDGVTTVTHVEALSAGERKEEIARMLAGARVTDEARAAADSLLAAGGGAT